jgi:hypothetical protein
MHLPIQRPDYASPSWADLPGDHRAEIKALLDAFTIAPAPGRGLDTWLRQQAPVLGITYSSLRAKYYALRNSGGDWTVLIDRRRTNSLPAGIASTREPRFIAHLLKLVESYQRKNAPAFRELRRSWTARRQPIPGYEGWPGWPQLPAGWKDRNLTDIVARENDKARLRSIRVGTSSKTNPFLPHILTTRVGLHPGAVIQLDDVWHDNIVTLGKKREAVRVLELGALDVFSAHRFHWGAKPRRRTPAGGYETLRGADMRLFLAGLFHATGYSPQGTMLMSEHATAKVEEHIARTLYDATRGMVRVEYQPIEGKQAALTGFWSGTEGGNFRAKACLESTHNLIHNDLAALAMQTGSPSSGLAAPVTTDRQLAYIARIVRDVLAQVPHRADLLRLPTLDFHTQFVPFLVDYYTLGLGARTDHDLEGWEALGHVVNEYTTAPGSDTWLTEQALLSLPDAARSIIATCAQSDPATWSRRRKLSPREVWDRRPCFQPVPPIVLCDMVGADLAREVTARRGFIEFADQDISADPLIYQARYAKGPRAGREIPHGEKVKMFVFPFDDSATAIVVDAQDRYLGELPLYKRVLPIDPAAFGSTAPFDARPDIRSADLHRAAGEKHSRIADIMEPVRIRHAETVQTARDLRAHNAELLRPDPTQTPPEKSAATRLSNRVAATAASIDTDNALDAWSTPDLPETMPDPDTTPEPFDPFT